MDVSHFKESATLTVVRTETPEDIHQVCKIYSTEMTIWPDWKMSPRKTGSWGLHQVHSSLCGPDWAEVIACYTSNAEVGCTLESLSRFYFLI
jgi:hypothetical protein